MSPEEFRNYCMQKPWVTCDFPFDEFTLVFRIGGKMFALTDGRDRQLSVNLKCNPEKAIIWREQYSSVRPGWHMNKRHWNTVEYDGSFTLEVLQEMIDDSYMLVFQSLPKKIRQALSNEENSG